MKTAIIYRLSRFNRQSFSVLQAALEKENLSERLNLFFIHPEEGVKEISWIVSNYDLNLICYSFMTPHALNVTNEVRLLKDNDNLPSGKMVYLIAGGPHPSGAPQETLEMGFNLVIRGEGEETFPALLHCLIEGRDYTLLRGIYFKKDNLIISNPTSPPLKLDLYPPFAIQAKIFGKIELSRGCPFGCRFCQTSYLFGFKMRHRSVETVARYVVMLINHGFKDLHFISPNALAYGSADGKTIDYERIDTLLFSLRKAIGYSGKIHLGSYPSEVRPEMVTREVIQLLKEYCDNKYILIGAQSGSPRQLEYLRRGHNLEAVFQAVEIILSCKFKAYVDFIFGLPEETDEDRELTLKAMKELTRMGAVIHGHTFLPLAGTPFSQKAPTPLNDIFRKELKRLASSSKLFGQWETQEKMGRELMQGPQG